MVKAITDRRGRILGATIAAPQAGELIQPWCLAISRRLKISALASFVPPYPTLGEASKRAAGSYFTETLVRPAHARAGAVPGPAAGLVRGGMVSATMARPRIVIVGAGFGGLSAAHGLAGAPADVTVIDRRNYHLFQPLLYQVATAGLSPAQIASADPRHPAPRAQRERHPGQRLSASTRSGGP